MSFHLLLRNSRSHHHSVSVCQMHMHRSLLPLLLLLRQRLSVAIIYNLLASEASLLSRTNGTIFLYIYVAGVTHTVSVFLRDSKFTRLNAIFHNAN